jgi:hypothetical protein
VDIAAHCELDRENGPPVVVKMGIIYIHDSGSNVQTQDIESFISHPQYKNGEKYSDIALIKLKAFIKFDENVRPACVCCLQSPGIKATTKDWKKAIAIGFGKTNHGKYTDVYF